MEISSLLEDQVKYHQHRIAGSILITLIFIEEGWKKEVDRPNVTMYNERNEIRFFEFPIFLSDKVKQIEIAFSAYYTLLWLSDRTFPSYLYILSVHLIQWLSWCSVWTMKRKNDEWWNGNISPHPYRKSINFIKLWFGSLSCALYALAKEKKSHLLHL